MNGQLSTAWRVLRLMLVALVVLAPAIRAEACSDRVALVEGGRGRQARPAVVAVTPTPRQTVRHLTDDETFRAAPRAPSVPRYLMHRAWLN